ncbi:hypothetical protein KCU65_g472, partial [Aureobasidium melanogenum]
MSCDAACLDDNPETSLSLWGTTPDEYTLQAAIKNGKSIQTSSTRRANHQTTSQVQALAALDVADPDPEL